MKSKKTVVLGASTNPSRYAYTAVNRLKEYGHEVIPVGIKKGEVAGIDIVNHLEPLEDIDTITLYVGPQNQEGYYDYIIDTKPNRVIFNPGTINPVLMDKLKENGVEVVNACTLVMLSVGNY